MLTSAVASSGILSAEGNTEMPLLLFVSVLCYLKKKKKKTYVEQSTQKQYSYKEALSYLTKQF